MLAVVCSIVVPPLLFNYGLIEFETAADRLVRIAVASGAAFLTAQLLDVTVFNWLRRHSWWRAPVFGSLAGSVLDTAIFFSVAFSAAFAFVGPSDAFALENAPLLRRPAGRDGALDVLGGWAISTVKLLIAVFALIPYRLIAAKWAQPVLA